MLVLTRVSGQGIDFSGAVCGRISVYKIVGDRVWLTFEFGGETKILRSELPEVPVLKTVRPSLAPIPELVPELATA